MRDLKVFFDADVLIAGSASKSGASFILLQLCELGIIEGMTCKLVIEECKRNITKKIPDALPVFNKIISKTLSIVETVQNDLLKNYQKMAHNKDLPILATAIIKKVNYLVTFNTKHYYKKYIHDIVVCSPGDLLSIIRLKLNDMV
jgi:predicted nucleic acid-binding protein